MATNTHLLASTTIQIHYNYLSHESTLSKMSLILASLLDLPLWLHHDFEVLVCIVNYVLNTVMKFNHHCKIWKVQREQIHQYWKGIISVVQYAYDIWWWNCSKHVALDPKGGQVTTGSEVECAKWNKEYAEVEYLNTRYKIETSNSSENLPIMSWSTVGQGG